MAQSVSDLDGRDGEKRKRSEDGESLGTRDLGTKL